MKNKKRLKFVSLFMIALMLALPVAFAQDMAGLNQSFAVSGDIVLEFSVPEFSKSKYLDVSGMTAPDARIEFFIGPTKVKVGGAGSDGSFNVQRIPLLNVGENNLFVKASVGDMAAQKSFTVFYDPNPPELNLSDIPDFVTSSSIAVRGDVKERVTIRWASYSKQDDDAPSIIAGLEVRDVKQNQVTLAWTSSDALDLLEYAVYRDGSLAGVSRTSVFVDNDVASGKQYEYRVAAVDTGCNVGVKSASKKAITSAGGSDAEKAPFAVLSCLPVYQSFETSVPFEINVPLQAGRNVVEISAADSAGNVVKVEKFVTVDTVPPQFLVTNLDAVGTTYIPEFVVRGTLSEKGTVFVYVNDDVQPSHFGLADDNGDFEIKVNLRSDIQVQAGQAAELDTGVGWKNSIKLKAVDIAGHEAWYPGQQQYKDVIYAICGYGAWLDFKVEDVTPSILTPRLLVQGIQQIGIPFTLTYIGGQQKAEIAGVVNAVPVRISPDLEKDFDNDKITNPQVWIKPRPGVAGVWDGYVQIGFVSWPVGQLEIEGNKTSSAIEKAISDWRRGEFHEAGVTERGVYMKPKCLNPFLGCMRIYLEIDIPLKEQVRIYDPQLMQETFEWKTVRQRNCLPLVMEIDQVIPPDVIRKDALNATSNFFGEAIALIDSVLDPLKTFTENMVYTCMATSVVVFMASIYKKFVCSRIMLAKNVDPVIAEAGLCKLAYGDKHSSCNACEAAIRNYNNVVQDFYTPVCDRIGCPSAPTLQKYILEKRNKFKDITSNVNALEDKNASQKIIAEWGVKGKVFSGSDCGFYPDFISAGYTVSRETPAAANGSNASSVPTASGTVCGIELSEAPLGAGGKIGVKEIYQIYRGDYEKIKNKCINKTLHPACPLCCGYEYMWEWNSACGVGNFLGTASYGSADLDTFNEIKESARLAAEKVGRGSEISDGTGLSSVFRVFNSLSGFCTASGNPVPDVVRTGLTFNPKIDEAEENLMQVFVFPSASGIDRAAGSSFEYRVFRGYLAKSFVIDNALTTGKMKEADTYSFSKTLVAVKEKELTKYFQNLGTDKEADDKKNFIKELCIRTDKITGFGENCNTAAPGVFEQVKSHIGSVEDEYIVRPSAGLWNSVQCICLTSLVAYLEQYRQISQAIKNCVDVIMLTGDGEEGMCRAMLSNYVCDLLWEIITCFANKWNAPSGKRITGDLGIGDVVGVLTGAGTDVANEVKGRYGETAMFNAMFNEKQLVHGLCLLAFGFEWNLDVQAMVQQSVESIPVESIVLGPTPAQARFIAWNPVTTPRGLTTWEYHFGLMISAGADLNARVKLKCSTGFGCSETDGFIGGECDCNKLGAEQVVSINPSCNPRWQSRINKNQLASYDCSYVVQQGKYRFDTIIFEYDYYDSGTKQTVAKKSEAGLNRVGSLPPAFCRFDSFSLSFRCQFGENPSGIRIDRVEPKYVYSKDNVPVFAMDEDLDFELLIRQQMPDTEAERAAGVKFLGYKLVNSAGTVIQELEPKAGGEFKQLKTDGSYKSDFLLPAPPDSWKQYFAKGAAQGELYETTVWSDDTPVMNFIKANVGNYIQQIDITAVKNNTPVVPEKRFVIDVKKTSVGVYVVDGFEPKGSAVVSSSNIIGQREDVTVGKSYVREYSDTANNVKYNIAFTLKSNNNFDKAEQIQFIIRYVKPSASADPCISLAPSTWRITFTSYDADKYGSVSNFVSVDPNTGEIQEKTIPFKIVCQSKSNLSEIEAIAVPADPVVAEGGYETTLLNEAGHVVAYLSSDAKNPAVIKQGVYTIATDVPKGALVKRVDITYFSSSRPDIVSTARLQGESTAPGTFMKELDLTLVTGNWTLRLDSKNELGKVLATQTYYIQLEKSNLFSMKGEYTFSKLSDKIRSQTSQSLTSVMGSTNDFRYLSNFDLLNTRNLSLDQEGYTWAELSEQTKQQWDAIVRSVATRSDLMEVKRCWAPFSAVAYRGKKVNDFLQSYVKNYTALILEEKPPDWDEQEFNQFIKLVATYPHHNNKYIIQKEGGYYFVNDTVVNDTDYVFLPQLDVAEECGMPQFSLKAEASSHSFPRVTSVIAVGQVWEIEDGKYAEVTKVLNATRGIYELKVISKNAPTIQRHAWYFKKQVERANLPPYPSASPGEIYLSVGLKYKIKDVYPGQVEIVAMRTPDINQIGKFISGSLFERTYQKLDSGQFWVSLLTDTFGTGLKIVDTLPDELEKIKVQWTTGSNIGREEVIVTGIKDKLVCGSLMTCGKYDTYGKAACDSDPCRLNCEWSDKTTLFDARCVAS